MDTQKIAKILAKEPAFLGKEIKGACGQLAGLPAGRQGK